MLNERGLSVGWAGASRIALHVAAPLLIGQLLKIANSRVWNLYSINRANLLVAD